MYNSEAVIDKELMAGGFEYNYFRYVCIFLFACSIAGCGFVKASYNKAPSALTWWLDDYFDFTNDQKALLRPALNDVHDWHRNNQLPEYIATLQELKLAAIKDNISSKQACEYIDLMKTSLNALQTAFIPAISEIAPLINEDQLVYLNLKLNKRAQKWKSEWWQETVKGQMEARLEKTVGYAEEIFGDLSSAQRAFIKQKLLNTPTKPHIIYAEIQRRNVYIFQIVSALSGSELNESQKYEMIKSGFERLQKSPDEEYQLHVNDIAMRTCEIIADLHARANQSQKLHASSWFGNIVNQLSNI